MQSPSLPLSVWQQLRQRSLTCQQALSLLVTPQGQVNLALLDPDLNFRFWRHFTTRDRLPAVMPLLLWRNCFYLGSPLELTEDAIQGLCDRLSMSVEIVPVTERSYRQWCRLQRFELRTLTGGAMAHSAPESQESETLTELAELYLSQADNQIERIRALIGSALHHRASDIHLSPTADGLSVRFRIDGILRPVTTLPADVSRKVIVSLKVMCDMDIAESRRPQDGRIGERYFVERTEQGLDLRVSTIPCISGIKGEASEKAVLRLLRQQNSFQTIQDLGFSEQACRIYEGWLQEPQGMIIFTGPTGSGKTSTLYTSLQAIAHESLNIVTIEDPVEYVLPGITQIQVHELAGMTFAAGLRAILRQDPDVIMVGEIRDNETAETAIRAALTGHLVLTTLHTNDAIGAIPRLKDIGPDPGLLSDALLGIVAQRLVRKICPHCSTPYQPTDAELALLNIAPHSSQRQGWRKGTGCDRCFQSGYLGREAIIELLNVDDTVRHLIYEGTLSQLRQYLHQIEYDSFQKAAIDKITQGITTITEIRRVLPLNAFQQG